jgi:hypothetical protein
MSPRRFTLGPELQPSSTRARKPVPGVGGRRPTPMCCDSTRQERCVPATDHPELHQAHHTLSDFLASVTASQVQATDAALSHLQIAACTRQAAPTAPFRGPTAAR